MKKIYVLLTSIVIATTSYAQKEQRNFTQLVYATSTNNSLIELESIAKDDKQAKELALLRLELLELKGKVILSTLEYAPIKYKIDNASKNPMDDIELEEKRFAEKAINRYVVVTELFKK